MFNYVNILKAEKAKRLSNLIKMTQKKNNNKRKKTDSAPGTDLGRWNVIKLVSRVSACVKQV